MTQSADVLVVVLNMALCSLYFIALFSVIVKCDVIYFNNDTITKLMYTAQMLNQQSCPTLDKGVVIAMFSQTEEPAQCKGVQNVPVDKIVVKHLISQANNGNTSTPLIYLYTDDGEFTDGNRNTLPFTQQRCIWAQRGTILLRQKGVRVKKDLTRLSFQTLLVAEYMQSIQKIDDDLKEKAFSITPDISTLVKVVSYFIITTGWTRVGLLHDATGIRLSRRFNRHLNMTVQVYQMRYDGSNANAVYTQYKSRNVRVILFTGLVQNYLQVLDDLYDYYYTGRGWVLSQGIRK